HRAFASELDAWATTHLSHAHGHDRAEVDATCRSLVRSLGEAGWLAHAVAGRQHGGVNDAIDTRSICLARDTLARHDGLADFAFAMQGLGSGAISLADFYVVFARTGDAAHPATKGARGISAFIVDADAPGFSIAERIDVIAPHPLARLRFNACRVPATRRIGAEGEGFKVAMRTLDV